MDGRECTKCGEFKPWDSFYSHPRGLHGRQSRCKACMRDYRATKDFSEYQRSWEQVNRERRTKRRRELYEVNREATAERSRRWVQANPDKHRARVHRYRARQRGATVDPVLCTAEGASMLESMRVEATHCVYCFRPLGALQDRHVEHIAALANGGVHGFSNLAISCSECNRRKSDRPLEDFLADLYRDGMPAPPPLYAVIP